MEEHKEILLTAKWLTEHNACEGAQRAFEGFFKEGSLTFTDALKYLQKLANTKPKRASKYVEYAKWLIRHAPKNKKPLILDKSPKGYLFYNGDVGTKNIDTGCHLLLGGGLFSLGNIFLSEKDFIDANEIHAETVSLKGSSKIYAYKIITKSLKAYDEALINVVTVKYNHAIGLYDKARFFVRDLESFKVSVRDNAYMSLLGTATIKKIDVMNNAYIQADGDLNAVGIEVYDNGKIFGNVAIIAR